MPPSQSFRFFLGGADLEMVTIRDLLLDVCGVDCVCDKKLGWGARLSDYANDIEASSAAGLSCVGIELTDDMPPDWGARKNLVLVDHHGERAQEASSLRQVFDLLALPATQWSRHFELVAANDSGHVRLMRAVGASFAEMSAIRAADRRAQGISDSEEEQGRAALDAGAVDDGLSLLIVRLPHARSATIMDPLALEARYAHLPKNVLVLAPQALNFFGTRKAVDALRLAYPQGYSGGQGLFGFFGINLPGDEILANVLACLHMVDGTDA